MEDWDVNHGEVVNSAEATIEHIWNQQDPVQIARDLNEVLQHMLKQDQGESAA